MFSYGQEPLPATERRIQRKALQPCPSSVISQLSADSCWPCPRIPAAPFSLEIWCITGLRRGGRCVGHALDHVRFPRYQHSVPTRHRGDFCSCVGTLFLPATAFLPRTTLLPWPVDSVRL